MARIIQSGNGTTMFEGLLGYNSEIMNNWIDLENVFFNSATFSAEFKEEIRRNLAQLNGCEYCKAKGQPLSSYEDKRLSQAVDFIKAAVKDRYVVEDKTFDKLKACFNDSEISELCAFIAFITASQNFGAMMNLMPVCSID